MEVCAFCGWDHRGTYAYDLHWMRTRRRRDTRVHSRRHGCRTSRALRLAVCRQVLRLVHSRESRTNRELDGERTERTTVERRARDLSLVKPTWRAGRSRHLRHTT